MCIHVQNMKFILSKLWPGRLPTDDDDDVNDDNGNTQRTFHD